jgi:cobalamin biosynthesis protein CbiM/cobalt ECF transporter T component CbiQ
MEGFLPWYWCVFWYLVSLPFLVVGIWKIRRIFAEHPEQKLTVAVSGAFIFVFSALKIPSVTGSSSHPTGTGLSTVLYGPFVTAVLASIVLVFQALLIAHGGITTLGANVFSMGIAGPMLAYVVYKGMQKADLSMAASVFTAAFLADFFTYIVTSFQLALAYPSGGSIFASFYTFFVIFGITQIPLAVAEGILIVIFFDYLARTRPGILEGKVRRIERAPNFKAVYALGAALVIGIIAAAVLINPGSGFIGTDDQGGEVIDQITGGFTPWTQNFWSPSEGLVYLLLAAQALLGFCLILYFLNRTRKASSSARLDGAAPRKGSRKASDGGKVGIGEMAFSSPARDWPPLGKLALVLALLFVSLLATSVFVPLIVLAVGASLLFYSTRFHLPKVLTLAILEALVIFAISTLIIAFLTQGGGEPLFILTLGNLSLSLYPQGAELAVMLFLRATAGLLVMLFFATSTPIPHFAQALRQMRVPQYITELVVLVYRYSFLLLEQMETMYTAAQCRVGFRGTRNKFRTTGKLAVGMFIRSMDVAERSEMALHCRNFRGDFPTFHPPAQMNLAWVALPVFVFGALYGLNSLIAHPELIGM